MRIKIYSADGGGVVELTSSLAEEMPDGLAGDLDYASEIFETLEGTEIGVRDLGNVRNPFSFTVTRSHDAEWLAATYYIDHPGTVPRKGRVEFLILNAAGTILSSRNIANALIKVRRAGWNVCETTMRYDIMGGAISSGAGTIGGLII